MTKVLVAMSGGVDSSVTAALLKRQGLDVAGITMQLFSQDRYGRSDTPNPSKDAAKVAKQLGIPHQVIDLHQIFHQEIISDFCQVYTKGKTPNPCVRCNQRIKFGVLLDEAKKQGFEYLATGHYARIKNSKGQYFLKKGADQSKDQSYFLYTLTQDQMAHILMPLGELTKTEVRQTASGMGLAVADKSESQEICFIPDNDYAKFLTHHLPQSSKPGSIVDSEGNILGRHRGIINYTIGQRRGLGIAASQPLYVTRIDAATNTIIAGPRKDTFSDTLTANNLNWISPQKPTKPFSAKAKIRYRHKEAEASVIPLDDGTTRIDFEVPQMAITPGQAIVFYQDDTVLGGATIK